MSISRISATLGTMSAAAAVSQAQSIQYASHLGELQTALSKGDLQGARQSLSEFQRVAAGAAVKGWDPLRQIPALAKAFGAVRDSLRKGDIEAAQKSFSSLQRSVGVVVSLPQTEFGGPVADVAQGADRPKNPPTVRKTPVEPRKDDDSIVLENLRFLGADAELLKELRSSRSVAPSANPTATSSTFIKPRPELTSFSQTSQVFPTSTDSVSKLSVPEANTLVQARVVVKGLAATQPNAQDAAPAGTAFAPTPELMLGSRGMSIPPGAQLRFDRQPSRLDALLR